jgi:sugar lactone lactonase YvrE
MPDRFAAKPFFEPPSEELRYLPECPRVLRNSGRDAPLAAWVAIQHGADRREGSLNVLDLRTLENTTHPLPGRPGFFVETDRAGLLVIGIERRLVLYDLDSGRLQETGVELPDDERVIINDGIAIPGGLLFGTKHLEFNQTIAALYHYECASGGLSVLVDRQICSNGKYFDADAPGGPVLVDIDSLPRAITRYRFDPGLRHILERKAVTPPEALPALPDGLRATPGGSSIIVAFYNPGAVAAGIAQELRLSDGAVLAEWEFPGSPRVTCPEFVRLDGRVQLLFTTAVEGMPGEMRKIAPEAGTLFLAPTRFDALPAPLPLLPAAPLAR